MFGAVLRKVLESLGLSQARVQAINSSTRGLGGGGRRGSRGGVFRQLTHQPGGRGRGAISGSRGGMSRQLTHQLGGSGEGRGEHADPGEGCSGN